MRNPWDWAHALLLVLIIFVWTPPHFWALAIFRREDYARALVPMLPVTHGVAYTRWQILLYTVLLVVATVLPWAVGMSGMFYLGGALVLGGVVQTVHVSVGQVINEGDKLVSLEAMKMVTHVIARRGGQVISIAVKAGDPVDAGQALLTIG